MPKRNPKEDAVPPVISRGDVSRILSPPPPDKPLPESLSRSKEWQSISDPLFEGRGEIFIGITQNKDHVAWFTNQNNPFALAVLLTNAARYVNGGNKDSNPHPSFDLCQFLSTGEIQPAGFDLVKYIIRQREFSLKTFGPGARDAGIIDHIEKELAEIQSAPDDVEEWVDVAILAIDAAWRNGWHALDICAALEGNSSEMEKLLFPALADDLQFGFVSCVRDQFDAIRNAPGSLTPWTIITLTALCAMMALGNLPIEIAVALEKKAAKNRSRTWPDWRTIPVDKAIEHDRSGESS